MTFLSPSILWALFAVSIPLIIHLFSLRQTRYEEFSSLRFIKLLEYSDKCKKEIINYILNKYSNKFEIDIYDNRNVSRKYDDILIILKKLI